MKAFFCLLTFATFVHWTNADAPKRCFVCQHPLVGSFYWVTSPVRTEKVATCQDCSRLATKCTTCGLPVKSNFHQLEDGRLLCEQDANGAVFDATEARNIFEETKREMFQMLTGSGVLPNRNITVHLIDGVQMKNLLRAKHTWHGDRITEGLTSTRYTPGQRDFNHTIYLLNGLGRAHLASVCAHEYGHTWLNENVSEDRRTDLDTVEGFCELLAYKLMTKRNEPMEKKSILANTYTSGQIETLIKAEDNMRFFRVIDWMKNGVGTKIDESNLAQILLLNESLSPGPAWVTALKTPVPETLVLKGISGTTNRRFALVNNQTLIKHERAKIRVGDSSVSVRCLDITDKSVVLAVDGSASKTELFLPAANP